MKNGLFHKRIPTLAALGILCIIVVISTILIRSGVFYVGKAAPEAVPQNILITNISDTSFAVVFTTPVKASGVINMAEGKSASIVLDDRDKKTGKQESYFSHHITIPNLEPNSTYTFSILVNGKHFKNTSYKATTGKKIADDPPKQNPLFGKILLPTGGNGTDTLVVAKTKNGQIDSDITSNDGAFIIPTNSWRNSGLSEYLIFDASSIFTITAFRETMRVEVDSTFKVAQNLPPVTLLETYSFIKTEEATSTSSSQLNIPQDGIGRRVDISTPENGQSFIDSQPLFTGTAYPNRTVLITIQGVGATSVSSNIGGVWSYRPTTELSQGEHTIVIESTDDAGKKITEASTFFVFPSGSQVSQSATPSATPTIQPTPTSTPTPTPTLQPTASPTPTTLPLTPTSTPTLTPTTLPTSAITPTTPSTTITPTPLPPDAGGINNSLTLTGISIVLIIAGALLLFAL